jgi:hypothetical protein
MTVDHPDDDELTRMDADGRGRHRGAPRLDVKIEQIWYFLPSPFARELVESVRRGLCRRATPTWTSQRRRSRRLLRLARGADGQDLRAVQGRHQPQRDRGCHKADVGAGCQILLQAMVERANSAKSGWFQPPRRPWSRRWRWRHPRSFWRRLTRSAPRRQASSWVSGLGIATALSALTSACATACPSLPGRRRGRR